MSNSIKRLVAVTYTVDQETLDTWKDHDWLLGDTFVILQDPETGKYYRPREGWSVVGENLEEHFVEDTF